MRVKTGVIGIGLMGQLHCSQLKRNKAVDLKAVADISTDRLDRLCKELGVNSYRNYEDMLAEENLDLVIVETPDSMHKDPVIKAATANVPHIICQKPLATTVGEAEEVVRIVEERGSDLYVLFVNRFNPMDMAVKYFLAQGLIGEPLYGEARLDDSITVPMRLWEKRSKEWAKQSSPAQFLLSHVIDIIRWYFSPAEVEEVYAFSGNRVLPYSTDIYDAYLFLDNDMKIRVKSEWVKHIDELVEFYLCLTGKQGNIIYNKLPGFNARKGLRLNIDRDINYQDMVKAQENLSQKGVNIRVFSQPNARVSLGAEVFYSGDTVEGKTQIDYFIDAIVEGDKEPSSWRGFGPLPSGQDGLEAVRVVSAIEKSAQERKSVRIER